MLLNEVTLKNIDLQVLCKLIDLCDGDVYLLTPDGNRLNLKSKLCQIVGLTSLLENATVSEAKLWCSNLEDDSMLFRYMLYGTMPQ